MNQLESAVIVCLFLSPPFIEMARNILYHLLLYLKRSIGNIFASFKKLILEMIHEEERLSRQCGTQRLNLSSLNLQPQKTLTVTGDFF